MSHDPEPIGTMWYLFPPGGRDAIVSAATTGCLIFPTVVDVEHGSHSLWRERHGCGSGCVVGRRPRYCQWG